MNEQNLRRGAGLMIDLLLISIACTVFVNLVPESLQVAESSEVQWTLRVAPVWYFLITAAYFFGCDLLNGGESLGKDIMGLQTRGPDGGVPEVPLRLFRTLLKLVSLALLPLAVLVFIWKGRDLTLQDYVTGTSVSMRRGVKPTP